MRGTAIPLIRTVLARHDFYNEMNRYYVTKGESKRQVEIQLILSFTRKQQDGYKRVERAAEDQNAVYNLLSILVWVGKQ